MGVSTSSSPSLQTPGVNRDWMLRRSGALQILNAKPLQELDWLVHGFSTRLGGDSKCDSASNRGRQSKKTLNLGFTDWDPRECVVRNRAKFFGALNATKMQIVTLRQIHSDIVHCVATTDGPQSEAPQADALITQARGILLAIQTADCVPILLADTKNRAVAAIHSGWRGTLRRIAGKTSRAHANGVWVPA